MSAPAKAPITVLAIGAHPDDCDLGAGGVAALYARGGHHLEALIDACDRLKDEQDFHCLIAGSGVAESRLFDQAVNKQLTNVTFLGRWQTRDMARLMSIGDVHLVSLRADPLAEIAMPSKLPATLACAKPVIVAARGDAETVVARSHSGWTCPPGDPEKLAAAIRPPA